MKQIETIAREDSDDFDILVNKSLAVLKNKDVKITYESYVNPKYGGHLYIAHLEWDE